MTAPVTHGSTNQSVEIRIIDSTDGTPEQSVEHNSAGIALWYRRRGGTKTAITPAALASLDAAHSDGGIEHIDDGYYRLDVPDAAFASGADAVMIGGEVTGMVVIGALVPLVAAKITGDPYAVVAHADYGNAKLVRSTTPANSLSVDANGKIATPDTQKVDVHTIKGQAVTCGAGVTINPQVGQEYKIGVNASGHVSRVVLTDLATATTSVTNAVTVGANNDKTGYGLSSAERTTLAAAIEAAIINDLDGTAVMQAIADLIASDMTTGDLSVQAIASAVRDAILNRVLAGNHDTAGTPGKLLQDGATAAAVAAVKAETASILADTAELQAAWADGGRLDLILDARASQATVDVVDGIADDIKAVTVKLNTGIEADGAVYRFTTNMLEQAPSGGGGGDATLAKQEEILLAIADIDAGSGSGAYAITVTVEDGEENPLQNATVRLRDGATGQSFLATTDASGEASFSLDGATYTVTLTKSLYQHTPESHVITAESSTHTPTFTMSAISLPSPSEDGWCTGYGYTHDVDGARAASQTVYAQMVVAADGDTDISDARQRDEVSDTAGLVVFERLRIGATYLFRYQDSRNKPTRIVIEADDVSEGLFALPNFVG